MSADAMPEETTDEDLEWRKERDTELARRRSRPAYWFRLMSDHTLYAESWRQMVRDSEREACRGHVDDRLDFKANKVAEHEGKAAGCMFRMLETAYDMGLKHGKVTP